LTEERAAQEADVTAMKTEFETAQNEARELRKAMQEAQKAVKENKDKTQNKTLDDILRAAEKAFNSKNDEATAFKNVFEGL
jgi:predicted HNH restriction endonuclease